MRRGIAVEESQQEGLVERCQHHPVVISAQSVEAFS